MALHMSERDNRAHWPADDIGRSAWSAPHRTHDTGPDTIPTDRAPLEAHGCWEPTDDRAIEDGGGVVVWLMLAASLGAVGFIAWAVFA